MDILYAYHPPYCCIFYYKGGLVYKQSEELGSGFTNWTSLEQIEECLGGYTFSRVSVKWAMLRGLL